MKKLVNILLSFSIILSCISVSFTVFAEEIEVKQIEYFAEKTVEVVNEYDEGKEFEAISDDTASDDDLRFQTARLFVKCSSSFNKMGAEEKVSGFNSWHLLQYSSPEEAKKAYNYYLNQKEIEYVEPDMLIKADLCAQENEFIFVTREEFFNDYSRKIMGFDETLSYIKDENVSTAEIKIGVLDSGIDYNHEIFENRIFRTYFNATGVGTVDDEYDIKVADGHGTAVCGNIVANTPCSVLVGCYKTLNDDGNDTELVISWIISALLKAYSDGCTIINMSFIATVETKIFQDTLEELYNNDIALFSAAGNDTSHAPYARPYTALCTNNTVYAVGGSNKYNEMAYFTNTAPWVRFLAPAEEVIVASPGNKYKVSDGTSFASPLAVAEYAVLRSINNEYSREKMIDLMGYTCQSYNDNKYFPAVLNNAWYGSNHFGDGILDALGALCELLDIDRASKVSFNLVSGENYHVGDKLILSADNNSTIYYTLNGEYPTPENWIEYTQPILLENYNEIHAISFNDSAFFSQDSSGYFRGFDVISEDEFSISEDGIITDIPYNYEYLEIPDTINGITVESIDDDIFYKNYTYVDGDYISPFSLIALKLPDSVEYINKNHGTRSLLANNHTIEYFSAKGLKNIERRMFYKCNNLFEVDIPNAERIEKEAFSYAVNLKTLSCPKVTSIDSDAFTASYINLIELPNLKTFSGTLFRSCSLEIVNLDSLENGVPPVPGNGTPKNGNIVLMESCYSFIETLFLPNIVCIYDNDLHSSSIQRLEMSKVKEIHSLPVNVYDWTEPNLCKVLTPSTLKLIDIRGKYNEKYENRNVMERVFYGTKGCYAETWANENGIPFVELNQDTAVVTDVREKCNKYTQTLFFDSLGFNKEYQWYGSFDNSTENGIALEGATKELLNLKDYREYPYYYCVCTSKDIDESENFEHTELIYSKVCENIDYASADYSALNEAVALAPSDLSIYTTGSVEELQSVLDSIDYTLPISEQATVDGYTFAIINAINGLELIPVEPLPDEPTETPTEKPTNPSPERGETSSSLPTDEQPTESPTNSPDAVTNPEIPNTSRQIKCTFFCVAVTAMLLIPAFYRQKKKSHSL